MPGALSGRCPSGLRSATGNRVRGESCVAGSNPACLRSEGPPPGPFRSPNAQPPTRRPASGKWPAAWRGPSPCPSPCLVARASLHVSAAASIRWTAAARAASFFSRASFETHLPKAFTAFMFVPMRRGTRSSRSPRGASRTPGRVHAAPARAARSEERRRVDLQVAHRTVCSSSSNATRGRRRPRCRSCVRAHERKRLCVGRDVRPGLNLTRRTGRRSSRSVAGRNHIFCEQPVNDGAGTVYTKTSFPPDGVSTWTWKCGDPALQSSSLRRTRRQRRDARERRHARSAKLGPRRRS